MKEPYFSKIVIGYKKSKDKKTDCILENIPKSKRSYKN